MKQKRIREYRTRPDPFADVQDQLKELLERNYAVEAKSILTWLQQQYPGRYNEGQLRTLQRRVRDWRISVSATPESQM